MAAQIVGIHTSLGGRISDLLQRRFEELQAEDPTFDHKVLAKRMHCSVRKVRDMMQNPSDVGIGDVTRLAGVMGKRIVLAAK